MFVVDFPFRYDMSYDVRDRARFLKSVTARVSMDSVKAKADENGKTEESDDNDDTKDSTDKDETPQSFISSKAVDILFCPKSTTALPRVIAPRDNFEVGSLSFMVRHCAPSYQPLPEFPKIGTDSRIRDPPVIHYTQSQPTGVQPVSGPSGDDFYDSGSESGSYTDGSGSYTDDSGSYTDDSGSYSDSDDSD